MSVLNGAWEQFLKSLPPIEPVPADSGGEDRIKMMCGELNWPVEDRGNNTIYVHVNSPGGGSRKVILAYALDEREPVATFLTWSSAVIPASGLHPDIVAYLLRRNLGSSDIGQWGMRVDDEERVTFGLMYHALRHGLDRNALEYIGKSMVKEAADLDGKLRQVKLLR
jgi:hypothetical protein